LIKTVFKKYRLLFCFGRRFSCADNLFAHRVKQLRFFSKNFLAKIIFLVYLLNLELVFNIF